MLNSNDVFCAFGDSITAGGNWVAEVFENLAPLGVKVFNCGVAGDTAYDSLRRIEDDCLCHSPSVVTVMFGVNDMQHWLQPDTIEPDHINFLRERYKESLEKAVKIFKERNVKVIVMSPPPYIEGDCLSTPDYKCNQRINYCVEFAKEIAQKNACKFIDINGIFNSLSNKSDYFNTDRVHPNEKGQRVIAKAVMQNLGFNYDSNCDEKFCFSQINLERMAKDSLYKKIMYAKHDTLGKYCDRMGRSMDNSEALEFFKNRLNASKSYVAQCAKAYCDNIDRICDIKAEIQELTEQMVNFYCR